MALDARAIPVSSVAIMAVCVGVLQRLFSLSLSFSLFCFVCLLFVLYLLSLWVRSILLPFSFFCLFVCLFVFVRYRARPRLSVAEAEHEEVITTTCTKECLHHAHMHLPSWLSSNARCCCRLSLFLQRVDFVWHFVVCLCFVFFLSRGYRHRWGGLCLCMCMS
jgi:hypothetical protein